MKIWSNDFTDGGALPSFLAFADVAAEGHVALSGNRNPHLAWRGAPAASKSFAIVCHDPDVPSRADDVNQEGREVAASLPRVTFYHWLLLDLPSTYSEVSAGSHSQGVTPRGKAGPAGPFGCRHGINDYTGWFAGDKEMGGDYYGYDGPCPPWNDTIVHHYHFTVYALDVLRPVVAAPMTGAQVLSAITPHVIDQAGMVGTYTLNPMLRARQAGA